MYNITYPLAGQYEKDVVVANHLGVLGVREFCRDQALSYYLGVVMLTSTIGSLERKQSFIIGVYSSAPSLRKVIFTRGNGLLPPSNELG